LREARGGSAMDAGATSDEAGGVMRQGRSGGDRGVEDGRCAVLDHGEHFLAHTDEVG
jgi:hypothetical protein